MPCNLTSSRESSCKNGLGGQSTLYLYDSLPDAFTILDGEATAMNVLLTSAYAYPLEGDNNTLEQSMVPDRNTGSRVNTQTMTITLKAMDAQTNAEFNILASGYPQAVIVDRNGNWHCLGLDDGIDFTVVGSTGGAKADLNGYTLTGIGTTKDLAPLMDSATIEAFKLVVV